MSDPVTNVEIEDVLSSIRRLVSEDSRASKPTNIGAERRRDRLVLTPSLRVQDGGQSSAAEPMVLTNPESMPEPEALVEVDASTPAEVEPEAAATPRPDTSADVDLNDAQDLLAQIVTEEIARAQEAFVLTDPAQDDAQEDTPEPGNALAAEEDKAEGQDEAAQDAAPEDADAPELQADDAEAALEGDAAQAEPEQSELEPSELAEEQEPEGPSDPIADPTLEQKIAELEALVGRSADPEPATFEAEEAAPTFVHRPVKSLQWEDHSAEPVLDMEPEDEYEDAFVQDFPVGGQISEPDPTAAPMVDEDALREMVTQLIRQELQGVLGERITRNVRKLVRREIHRVMMNQDFE